MGTRLNLRALEDFKKGDLGCATRWGATNLKLTDFSGTRKGSILVKASEDIQRGKDGWFEEASRSK